MHFEVIRRERWGDAGEAVVGGAMEGEDAENAAELGAAEGGGFGFGESAEFAGATLDERSGNLTGERRGGSAGAGGERENVEVGEGESLDEIERGGEVGLRFTGETADDVGADGGVGKEVADEFDAAGIVTGAIAAVHGGKDAVGAGLQRHMKVLGEAIGGSEERDEVLSDVLRFDGGNAKAIERSFVQDAAKEREKSDARREIAAVTAEIDARENDFASGVRRMR